VRRRKKERATLLWCVSIASPLAFFVTELVALEFLPRA
jgi:hypothetical protein